MFHLSVSLTRSLIFQAATAAQAALRQQLLDQKAAHQQQLQEKTAALAAEQQKSAVRDRSCP